MQQAIHAQNISVIDKQDYVDTNTVKAGFFKRFFNWCNKQEEYRFLWLGITLFGLIGMVLPLTLLSILFFANNNFMLWIIACAANVPVLALNLAAQPPKVTLPFLFITLVIDVAIIAVCTIMFIMG
jgi:hypothetical protein